MEAGFGPADDGGWHLTAPVFILAGEPSGDRLAASLMKAVNGAWGPQQWIGVGGQEAIESVSKDHRTIPIETVARFQGALVVEEESPYQYPELNDGRRRCTTR